MNTKELLKNHLIELGLSGFKDKKDYNIWSTDIISNSNLPEFIKEKYYSYLIKHSLEDEYKLDINFYDLIAKYDVLYKVVHSFKFKDILLMKVK